MFKLNLFLGFAGDQLFQKELNKANATLRSLLIGKKDYLEEVNCEGKSWLGKHLAEFPTLEEIEGMEKHLVSLLKKLTPNYPFSENPPRLVTLDLT